MNNTSVLSVAKNRVVWLDVVRFVAMFTVVCCHCADPFNFIRVSLLPSLNK